jgi:PAS domain S-box-containing protein
MHSELENKLTDIRNKFLGLEENSSVKSYYPQLREKIIELEKNENYLKDKSTALLNILEDLEVEKKRTKESEEKYRKFFDQDLSGVFISTPEGKLKACNPAYVKMMEYDSIEDLLSTNAAEHYDKPEAREEFLNLLREKRKLIDYEGSLLTKNGKTINTLENIIGVFDDNNNLVEFWGYVNDITTRKNAEQILKNAAAEKEALHRELLHRVKNSFALIKSLVYLERMNINDSQFSKVLEQLENRIGSLAHMYSILNETGASQSVELNYYLQKIIKSLVDSYIEKNQNVSINSYFDKIIVSPKDASSIGLIVNELLTNSLKYAFDAEAGGEINVKLIKDENVARLTFSDNGKGLPDTFSIEESTGMGLQLVKMLTEQLSGKTEFNSKNGTTFIITLPLKD